MKNVAWIGLGIVLVAILVIGGLEIGWAVWGHRLWAAGPFAMPRPITDIQSPGGCGEWEYGTSSGTIDDQLVPRAPCEAQGYGIAPASKGDSITAPSDTLTIGDAYEALEQYIAAQGILNLEVVEVMEFKRNFYASVRERDTGIGAMELLVDKWTGSVAPEIGPNMMWNTRYGMHRRRTDTVGGGSEINSVTSEEALEIARHWLDAYRPGVIVEKHADPSYGYYTIHTLEDGEIEGMLSVHGTTGQVWYHAWHGQFIHMVEREEHD